MQPSTTQHRVDVTVNVAAQTAPSASAGSKPVASPLSATAIIVALVLFFPVGLVLMWTRSSWSTDTRWAVTGLFFWPLWGRFVWREAWPRVAKVVLVIALCVSYVALFSPRTAGIAGLIGIGSFVWTLRSSKPDVAADVVPATQTDVRGLRRIIESKLDTCHDFIAEIEGDMSLELLPSTSPAKRRYAHGLEMREEALKLLERAETGPDLIAANERISRAVEQLRQARDSIVEIAPGSQEIRHG